MHRHRAVTTRPFLFAVLLGAAGVLSPTVARAEEAQEAPASRVRIEDRGPNRLLMATGLATFGFSYSVSAYVGAASQRESDRFLVVPAAGPFIALVERDACGTAATGACTNEMTYEGLLVASGVMQLAGLAQIGLAFITRERREVERPLVMPQALRGGAGLGAVAQF